MAALAVAAALAAQAGSEPDLAMTAGASEWAVAAAALEPPAAAAWDWRTWAGAEGRRRLEEFLAEPQAARVQPPETATPTADCHFLGHAAPAKHVKNKLENNIALDMSIEQICAGAKILPK